MTKCIEPDCLSQISQEDPDNKHYCSEHWEQFKPARQNPNSIIDILHSIKKVEIAPDGTLVVWQDECQYPDSISAFIPKSFTYDLLCLIEEHLTKG